MSLNYDLTRIHDFENLCWIPVPDERKEEFLSSPSSVYREDPDTGDVKRLNPVTNSLIWSMLSLGVKGKITASNAAEVTIQLAIMQRLHGAYLCSIDAVTKERTPRYITEEDVQSHIGLSTNCYGQTKRHFKESLWKTLRSGSARWLENTVADAKKAAQEAA